MKIKQYYSWMVAAAMAVATPFLAACSSEENLAPSRGVAVTDAHIVINVEPYGATPTATKSRAAEAPAVTKPDTVLLANGMRAVVSMEEDAPETQAATRATMDDGHYTIFALDPATGDRITGPDTRLTGTVTGGVFQSDAGSKMILDPGTYKFVCINDAVTDHGTWLEVKTGVSNNSYGSSVGTIPSASDAQIGTATETISGDDWQVTFAMKHQNARIRLRLVAYTNQLENAVGALTGSLAEYPTAIKYALDGSTPVVTEKTLPYDYAIAKLTLPNTPTESNATYVKANNFYSNYMYVMPEGEQIALWLGEGKAYGKSFNLASPTKLMDKSLPSKFQRNHSYTITYRLLPEALYLFQDGSCGVLSEKGTRTPIAVVSKEKTNSEEGTAVALKDCVSQGGSKNFIYGSWPPAGTRLFKKNNTSNYSNMTSTLNDVDGYKWTWETAGSEDGTVKANDDNNYTCFYAAANYKPGVETQNIGKWYLPATGEFKQLIACYGTPTITTIDELHVELKFNYINLIDKVFTDAGGDAISASGRYWTSSEMVRSIGGGSFNNQTPVLYYDNTKKAYVVGQGAARHNTVSSIRPFVHF